MYVHTQYCYGVLNSKCLPTLSTLQPANSITLTELCIVHYDSYVLKVLVHIIHCGLSD